MAYEPKTWECGEVVTADALNHLEQGVASASGSLIFTATEREATAEECDEGGYAMELSHSWQEIHDALKQGRSAFYVSEEDGMVRMSPFVCARWSEGFYECIAITGFPEIVPIKLHFTDATSKVVILCGQD